jgi:hypothetical protein
LLYHLFLTVSGRRFLDDIQHNPVKLVGFFAYGKFLHGAHVLPVGALDGGDDTREVEIDSIFSQSFYGELAAQRAEYRPAFRLYGKQGGGITKNLIEDDHAGMLWRKALEVFHKRQQTVLHGREDKRSAFVHPQGIINGSEFSENVLVRHYIIVNGLPFRWQKIWQSAADA